MSGWSSIRSHSRAPLAISFCLASVTASPGAPVGRSLPRLHLDEGKDSAGAIPADQVHFPTVGRAEVLIQDFEFLLPKKAPGQMLTYPPEPNVGISPGLGEEEGRLLNGFKRLPMDRARPMNSEISKVLRGAIAFVRGKAILRIAGVHFYHQPVPRDFRNDARRRNAKAERVAADERRLRDRKGSDRSPSMST